MKNFKIAKALIALLLVFMLSVSTLIFTQGQASQSNITVTNMPNLSIAQIAASNSNYSTLVSLVQLANLTEVLDGPLPLTVFAPTNAAFAKLPNATVQALTSNTTLLRSILAYHVIPNVVVTPEQLMALKTLPTASGQIIQVSTLNASIRVNDIPLVNPSINARNGIIHTIDTVLTPPNNASVTPFIVPANQTTITTPYDLTNQNSPYAATLIGNLSYTKLVSTSLPQVTTQLVASNFTAPMMIVPAKDNTSRLFVVDQIGLVWIINANGTRMSQPFMDLRSRIVQLNPVYDERGLLSLAFHPNFTSNGKLYVHYDGPLRAGGPANWSHTVRISEFTVDKTNPNIVNNASERILMMVDKPQSNHNGGPVLFGNDGYLYLTLGDGGGANDINLGHTNQTGNAQDLTKVLGKTLRIDINQNSSTADLANRTQPNLNYVIFSGSDVLGTRPYGIPKDNPFVGYATLPPNAYGNIPINGTIPLEIYSYGHRNPAFASFYSNNSNALMVSEAGQQLFEEVNIVRRGGDYGWRLLEGTHAFNATDARNVPMNATKVGYLGEPLIGPIFEGGHDLGVVVVGGATYWGNAIPQLQGKFVFGYFGNAPAVTGNGILLVASPPAGWNASNTQDLAKCMMPTENTMWQTQQITIANAAQTNATGFVRGVSADRSGELYIMMSSVLGPNATTGRIYKIMPSNSTPPPTPTPTPTNSPTPNPSASPSPSPSVTPTTSPTPMPTLSPSPSPTLSPTSSPTPTSNPTSSPSPSPTSSPTTSPTTSPYPTNTPSPEPTSTESPSPQIITIRITITQVSMIITINGAQLSDSTLNLKAGDIVNAMMTNMDSRPHCWAITSYPNSEGKVMYDAVIGQNQALNQGESASDTFTVTQPGKYYYMAPTYGSLCQELCGRVIVAP